MGKNRFFSVFVKFLSPALAVLFLGIAVSCKTAAPPPVQETPAGVNEPELSQASDSQSAVEQEPLQASDVQSVESELPQASDAQPVEPELPASPGPGSLRETGDEEPALAASDMAVPPEVTVEEEPALPEPEAIVSEPPRETPPVEAEAPPSAPPAVSEPEPVQPTEITPPPGPARQESEFPQLTQPSRQEQSPAPEPEQALPKPGLPQQAPVPSASREPPAPPSFLRPAEPEIPPPVQQIAPPPEPSSRPAPESDGEQVVFSRVVRATVGQTIEIPFRGTGWVYLGELGNRRGIAYDSRRLDIEGGFTLGQSFIFIAEAAGTYILKFYKQDFIQDYIINDYVQIIVGEASEDSASGRFGVPVDRGRVVAEPRWPPATGAQPATGSVPSGAAAEAADGSGAGVDSTAGAGTETGAPSAGITQAAAPPPEADTAAQASSPPVTQSAPPAAEASPAVQAPSAVEPQSPPPTPAARPRQTTTDDGIVAVAPPQAASSAVPKAPDISPDALPAEYVRRARQEFDAGRVESALTILDTMKLRYPAGSDEAWWLYGQLLEANSPSRDIRLSLEYYRRLVKEYPQSNRAGDAQRRIAYLERYYFNIR